MNGASLFREIDKLFSSLELRLLTKMMVYGAVNVQNARTFKNILTPRELEVLPRVIEKKYVAVVDDKYYLTKRGASIASFGMKKLAEKGLLP